MVPVVMKQGTDAYMKVNFQLLQAQSPFGEQAGVIQDIEEIRATLTYDDGSVYILAMQDVNIDPIPFIGLSGDAILRVPMQNGIGRHRVNINWEFDLVNSESETITVDTNTPEVGAHMIYTVLDRQPSTTTNTGDSEEKSYIWYNPASIHEEIPSASPSEQTPSRSPLDLACYWASGATDGDTALELIASNLYENGGYQYYARTEMVKWNFGFSGDSNEPTATFRYAEHLRSEFMECNDAAAQTKLMANFLGLPATIVRLEPAEDDKVIATPLGEVPNPVFTNYIQMVGEGPKWQSDEGGDYFPPRSVVGDFFGHGFGAFVRVLKVNPGPDEQEVYTDIIWKQWDFSQHVVTQLNGRVVDASSRTDSVSRGLEVNPDFFLNQMNFNHPEGRRDVVLNVYKAAFAQDLPQSFIENSRVDYALLGPSPKVQSMVTLEEFLNAALYLYEDRALRKTHGFNDFDLETSEAEKLEIVK